MSNMLTADWYYSMHRHRNILDSLLVSCKYAENGCKEMFKRADIEKHEKEDCEYEPFRCPVELCTYQGSDANLPVHLTEEHRVQTVALNNICGVGFIMKSSDQFVMVKSDEENDLLYLVHRQLDKTLGDVFFCTSLRGYYGRVSLKVAFCSFPSICFSITGARASNLRKQEYWKQHRLMLPFIQPLSAVHRSVEVHFSVAREEEDD